LKTPRGSLIRPTTDRVRAALFDVVGARVDRARFLDVYAGTGAVGCEALSRGAARAVFLERDRTALRLIAHNVALGSWTAAAEIVAGEARAALQDLQRADRRFDIVFLDPPYDDSHLPEVLPLAAQLLSPGGMLIVEHRSNIAIDPPAVVQPFRSYEHGDTALTVCRAPGDVRPA
jgi:16S rRNA (guanine966-N2)-methyltransferase